MPQKVGSKKRKTPGSKQRSVCTTSGCNNYFNKNDKHSKCVACLSPRHFQLSQVQTHVLRVTRFPLPLIGTVNTGKPAYPSQSEEGTLARSHTSSVVDSKGSREPSESGVSVSESISLSHSGVRDDSGAPSIPGPTHPGQAPPPTLERKREILL